MQPQTYLKAIVAALGTGLGILFLALSDGVVTPQEWVGVAQGALVTGAAVFGIPNLPAVVGAAAVVNREVKSNSEPVTPPTPPVDPAPPAA